MAYIDHSQKRKESTTITGQRSQRVHRIGSGPPRLHWFENVLGIDCHTRIQQTTGFTELERVRISATATKSS